MNRPVLEPGLAGELAAPLRLAIGYASPAARPLWAGLLLLDRRLEGAALRLREPLIAQIKLAWWRERFSEPVERWPGGEPLLALLRPWDAERAALAGLVDGWEGLVGGDGGADAVAMLARARAAAVAGLARLAGCGLSAARAGELARCWALDDLAVRLGRPRADVRPIEPYPRERLPRPLRPLAILAELAAPGERPAVLRLARIVRLGLLGR